MCVHAVADVADYSLVFQTDVTVAPQSVLASFQQECKGTYAELHGNAALKMPFADKTAAERGKLLEESKIFADIHAEAAKVASTFLL